VHRREDGDKDRDARLERFLREVAVARWGYTAAVARVDADGVVARAAAWDRGEPSVDERSRFDLASLTKPFVATLAAELDAAGRLPLDREIGELIPAAHPGLARRTLDDLLRHRSGLLPWAPLYAGGGGVRSAQRAVAGVIAEPRWWGARRGTYSDLGYLVFGVAVRAALGRTVGELMASSGWGVSVQPGAAADVVRSRLDTGREVELAARLGIALEPLGPPRRGRAQDGNARTLGGVPGHAGLFADLDAVSALGRAWLTVLGGGSGAGGLDRDGAKRALAGAGSYARGWRRATRRGSAGPALSAAAFGHDGFTGGSLWIDPDRRCSMVLLGHRRDERLDLRPLRRGFHRLALRLAGS